MHWTLMLVLNCRYQDSAQPQSPDLADQVQLSGTFSEVWGSQFHVALCYRPM